MSHTYTLDDLHRMSWQDFEATAVEVVRRLYSKYGIEISRTPLSHDGGKDGDGQHILAIGLGPDLAISIKILLEIKKRTSKNVGKSDLGSHIVDAFRNRATKVIFITNREFTEPLCKWLAEFCGPLNIQFSLISGSLLLGWLNGQGDPAVESSKDDDLFCDGKTSPNESQMISGYLTYTLDPNDATGSAAACNVRSDRPVFAIIDFIVGKQVPPFDGTLELIPKRPGALVHRIGGANSSTIFSPGDRHRYVFAIWPETPGLWDESCFEVVLGDTDIPIHIHSTNSFYVPEQGLGSALAGTQAIVEKAMHRSLHNWKTCGGISLNFLLSPGGLGKSYIVGRLRKEWQSHGFREAVLDGEIVSDDVRLVQRTFATLFPFPKSPFDDAAKPALERWLRGLNLSPEACETLATDFCSPTGLRPDNYSAGLRAQMFAALLAEASATGGLIFVFEDLHKVSPSVLSVLEEALSLLRGSGRGNVFVLLTSRPAKEVGTVDITAEWLARLQELSALAEDAVNVITPLSEQDARAILSQAVSGLEGLHVQQIAQQVGTTPFNLREAVLYLRQLHVLQVLESGGRPILAEPDKLNLLLEHEGLDQITRRRLEVFFREKPLWLRKLIEAGACYGRQFPFVLVAKAASVPDQNETMEAIAECARWSLIALSSDFQENLEFDHDLVRAAVLTIMPGLRRRGLANSLLEQLENDGDLIRKTGLAYQAGHAEMAFDFARLSAHEQTRRGRPADALKANHIALLTLDPEWASFDTRSSSWVDLAVLSAPTCRREFTDWRERDKVALSVLRDNLHCLASISAGSSGLSDATLTEARMLSERLADHAGSASLIAMEGRMLFERNDIAEALARHEEAEKVFAGLALYKPPDRAENLIRLAICLRQMGRRDDSLKTLRQALKYRVKSDWSLVNKVRSNTGAAYLRSDWTIVRYHWERQLRSARSHQLIPRVAHALASLSFINLFDARQDEGRRQAEEALEIAREQGLDNTRLRCDLNLSVASLMEGNIEAAFHYLNEAESIAVQHQIGRRLWRVYANLATTHELQGMVDKAKARDLQTVIALKTETWEADSLLLRGRTLLPLLNLAFRANITFEPYQPLIARALKPETALALQEIASTITDRGSHPSLDVSLNKYLITINGRPRFLLTE